MRPYTCAACLLSFPTPAELEGHACRWPRHRICPACGLVCTADDIWWIAHLEAHQMNLDNLPLESGVDPAAPDADKSEWYTRLHRYIDRQLAAGPDAIPELDDPVRSLPPLTDWEWVGLWALMDELAGDDLKL